MTYGYSDALKITGLVELQTKLTAFGDKVVNVVTQKALLDGARIIQKEVIKNARDINNVVDHNLKIDGVYERLEAGNLAKNIRIRRMKKTEKGTKTAQVYVKLKRAWYAKFVEGRENGTSRQVASPFMRPAFEAKKEEAIEKFRTSIEEAIVSGRL